MQKFFSPIRWLACLFACLLVALLLLANCARAETRVRLTFTGDVTLGCEEKVRQEETSFEQVAAARGLDSFLANVKALFAQDDLTVVNLEGVLSDSSADENTEKTYRFRGSTAYTSILTGASVEAANLANNHTRDYGERGYRDTVAALDAAGVGHFGGREVYFFDKGNVRLAFLGMSYTEETKKEKAWLKQEIARLKQEEGASAVIFLYHGGQEYGAGRNERQQEIARLAVDAGADLVVMHHPHVVQGMSVLDNRSVFYSLGNFCFGGNQRVKAMESLVVVAELTFSDDGEYLGQQMTLHPAHVSGTSSRNDYQPCLVSGDEARAVMRRVRADTRFKLGAIDPDTGALTLDYLPAVPQDAAE